MYKIDYHLHSVFSPDGHQTLSELVNAAEKAGLSEICVTEHCECNDNAALPPEEEAWFELDIKRYTDELEMLKSTSSVKIKTGVEIGQATQGLDYAKKAIAAYDWDFIIGSLHNVRNEYDFCFLQYANRDLNELFKRYFEQLYETCELDNFSVLGHLYYPVRYIYRQGLTLDISPFDGIIHDIFKLLISNGRGIEINTSGLFSEFGGLIPELKYAKMFRSLGGKTVTVGSDAHYSQRVGGGVETAYEMLREAGFKAITVFNKQKPEFIDL